jgi:hypothetical protein
MALQAPNRRLEFRIAAEKIVHFLPAVVIRIGHLFTFTCVMLIGEGGSIALHWG